MTRCPPFDCLGRVSEHMRAEGGASGAFPRAVCEKGMAMRRCNNCQYENAEEAKACARCAQPLSAPVAVAASAGTSLEAPDWLQGMQLKASDDQDATTPATNGSAVAAAATLPVQIRRSRVPVLAVDARRSPQSPPSSAAERPLASIPAAAGPVLAPPSARRPSRLLLLLILAVIIAALVYAAIRLGL